MAKRRGHGEGSIFQRTDGRWTATITVGRDTNGKRLRKTVYGDTKRAVTEELTRLQNQKLDGTLKAVSRLTVAEFLEQWLNTSASLRVRRTTLDGYRQNVRLHIVPVVGSIRLEQLTPVNVLSIYRKMADAGKSPRLQQLVHTILRRALSMAVKWRLVVANVCDAVDRPSAPRHEAKFLDAIDSAKFLKQAQGDRLEALYVLAITSGLRQGELLGLEWQDIDFQGQTLTVRRSLNMVKGEFWTEEPKTDRSRRRVALPAIAMNSLQDHRRRMMAEGRGGDARVFSMEDGAPIGRDWLLKRSFRPLLKAAKLPVVRFHDLRHTSASLLFAQGVNPKVVQERLGHSSIQMTMDIYSHAIPTMQVDAAGKFDDLFSAKLA